MNRTFDTAELLRVAVIEERNGATFYDALAARVSDDALRRTFAGLAAKEREHEARFQAMLDAIADTGKGEAQYPDIYVDYLETLINDVRDHEAVADDCASDADAVDTAIGMERDQLALQRDIADVLGETQRAITQAVIDEERGHLVTLGRARKRLHGS